jgi:transcriptional regulator with XRE-family HTH domain
LTEQTAGMIKAEGRANFGPLLRRERELRNWSQQELIQRILDLCAEDEEYPALDPKTVGRWKRGAHKPSLYYRKHLCQVFGRNPIQLGSLE